MSSLIVKHSHDEVKHQGTHESDPLSTRAIHVKLIEIMDTSSFMNTFGRFVAIRGPVLQTRSDCGTNFTGARNELKAPTKEMDQKTLETYLNSQGHDCSCEERTIGICRRILDSLFAELKPTIITNDVLSTLMAEVTAIVNNRP